VIVINALTDVNLRRGFSPLHVHPVSERFYGRYTTRIRIACDGLDLGEILGKTLAVSQPRHYNAFSRETRLNRLYFNGLRREHDMSAMSPNRGRARFRS